MKVCISSTGQNLEATVDPRFGRAQYFVIADSETMEFEAIANPAMTAGGGAGTKASQLVIDKGARVVLTGNVGPNAFAVLNAAKIAIHIGASGSIRSALAAFRDGKLQKIDAPSVEAHSGAISRAGRGRP
jgi:predicted Fe-Mo cluster-binding NifX family protein